MKADTELIRRLIHGAVRFSESNGEYTFSRFTGEQRKVYLAPERFSIRAESCAGMRLEFETDAASFRFSGRIEPGSSRLFYWFDVIVNGYLRGHFGSENREEQPEFSYEMKLDPGMKHVSVYFPGLSKVILRELEFISASCVTPVKKKKTIICYGDSITQGYDARYASLAYPNQLAEGLDAEVYNKAIGGEIFHPELTRFPDPVKPDLITVAYGTNDWIHSAAEDFRSHVSGFFRNLNGIYPDVPVLVILPVWRTKCETLITAIGSFADMHGEIRKVCAQYPQIRLIDGLTLIPHREECFSPDVLHPNDFGFQFMGKNLLRAISELKIF